MLIVNNLHFEPIDLDEATLEKFIDALKAYVLFNQCRDLVFIRSNQNVYLGTIRKGFS